MTRGFNQIPFGTTGHSGLMRASTPAHHLPCKRYNRGLGLPAEAQNQYLPQGQSSAPDGCLAQMPNSGVAVSDQEHQFRLVLIARSRDRSAGDGCSSVLGAPKGSVDCVHQFRRPLLSSLERLSLQAPLHSRHPTLRHRGLTRTLRDRSRYPGQRSRQWSTTRRRLATLELGPRSPSTC